MTVLMKTLVVGAAGTVLATSGVEREVRSRLFALTR